MNIVIYHANCADGFGAAYAAWRKFDDDAKYIAASYGEDPPDVAGHDVYIVDFSYKRPVLWGMAKAANSLTLIDHHKTAQEDLDGFAEATGATVIFDQRHSGAVLAWKFFHPANTIPDLLEYIEDRDLWHFKFEATKAIHANLVSKPFDFRDWCGIDVMFQHCEEYSFIREGEAILRSQTKHMQELVANTLRPMNIGGVIVPVANVPGFMASDAGNHICNTERTPFSATYYDGPRGRAFSLRSLKTGADVSKIAKYYGGGGHATAAGFLRPLGWEGETEFHLISPEDLLP